MTDRSRFIVLSCVLLTAFIVLHAAALRIQQSLAIFAALTGAFTYYGLLLLLAYPLWHACIALARRSVPWTWTITGHVALLIVSVLVWIGCYFGLIYLQAGPEAVRITFQNGGPWLLLQSLTNYTMLVAGIVSLQSQQRLAVQRRKEVELRGLAQQAELRALRAQLRPHFIFNVLNSIYALIPLPVPTKRRLWWNG
ncbi:MAG: histidine kinase [Myxococcota bacterium]